MSRTCVDGCSRMKLGLKALFFVFFIAALIPVLNCLAPLGCKAGQVSFAFRYLALIPRRHVSGNDWQVDSSVAPPPPLEFSESETCARETQREITDSSRLSLDCYSHMRSEYQTLHIIFAVCLFSTHAVTSYRSPKCSLWQPTLSGACIPRCNTFDMTSWDDWI